MKMKNVIRCEHAYSKEFCTVYENDDLIRFTDVLLPKMRDHNYTYIKNNDVLKNIIESEIELANSKGKDFLKIVFDADDDNLELPNLHANYNVDKMGYYCFDIANASNIKGEKTAVIKKVNQEKMIEDIIFCDLEFDGDLSRKEFHTKKNKRRGEVYLADNQLDAYICYDGDDVVGICDLFMYEKIAKIENFLVIPRYQRQGYGTFILKRMIDIALENGVELIYLITDEVDTAKEMYEKLYFDKVGEKVELVVHLLTID